MKCSFFSILWSFETEAADRIIIIIIIYDK